jgi:N-carbamoyl-L-amino-acid hydrolase
MMINIGRLKVRMKEMAGVGKTERGGVTRLALSKEDKKARELFIQWMNDLGLQVRVDDFGNIYGRSEGTDPDAPVIMAGSHLDSVPKGGKFDGVLGVLSALEAVETMSEQGIKHRNSIEIVSFTNEEGTRFMPQMLGSGAVTGQFCQDYVYDRKDAEGFRFEDELRKIGFIGDETNRLDNVSAFIEMHVEQGPILEVDQKNVGVVEGVAGFSWMEIKVVGQSDHSGSTPMTMRKDSLVTSASIIEKIHHWAKNRADGTVATVGLVRTTPGVINAVPGETVFTIDVRNPQEDSLYQCREEIIQIIKQTVERDLMDFSIDEIRSHPPCRFSNRIINTLEEVCRNFQFPYKRVSSGAAHDAMYMNHVTETAMIFVPSAAGKSHCEEEYTSWDDIEKGTAVLYETLARLAK